VPIWGIFGGRVGGRGIPQMVCESLPRSFGKRGRSLLAVSGWDFSQIFFR